MVDCIHVACLNALSVLRHIQNMVQQENVVILLEQINDRRLVDKQNQSCLVVHRIVIIFFSLLFLRNTNQIQIKLVVLTALEANSQTQKETLSVIYVQRDGPPREY